MLFLALIGSAIFFYDSFYSEHTSVEDSKDRLSSQKIFSKEEKLSINSGEFIQIPNRDGLNPKTGRDFYMMLWLKSKRYPVADQRMLLFNKIDGSTKPLGYAFGISRYDNDFYPQVYWRGPKKGRWFSFSKFFPKPKRWYGFLISYTENAYLGLHLLRADGDSIDVKKLGGQIVENVRPESAGDLFIGSLHNKHFLGNIAKFLAFAPSPEEHSLKDVLERIKNSPEIDFSDYEDMNPVLYLDTKSMKDLVSNQELALKQH